MSVTGCQGSQGSYISISVPGGLPATLSSGPRMTICFQLFFESVDRRSLRPTLRTVCSCFLSYVSGGCVAEVCITTRVFTPLWHVLIQASDNIVAVTVTTVVAVPQSEWLCHSDRQVSPVTMNWPIFFLEGKQLMLSVYW